MDDTLNMPRGISGYFASHFSLYIKSSDMKQPKITRQTTCDELQGKVVPPKSSPRSSINVNPRIERLPNQSTAFMPSTIFVRGLCTSRNSSKSKKAIPHNGKLIQYIHLHETFSVRAPPMIGPTVPAIAHTNSRSPRYKLRRLAVVSLVW